MMDYKVVYPGSDEWKNCKTPQACHLTVGTEKSKPFCMTCSIVGFGLSDYKEILKNDDDNRSKP